MKNNGLQYENAYNNYSIHNIVFKILNFICVEQNAGKFSVMQVHMVWYLSAELEEVGLEKQGAD